MFEAGFLEMLLIGVIALLVVGPERLPGIARKTGEWVGKIRRFIANSKQDLERELRTEEMRNMLMMQEEQIRELRDTIKQTADDTKKDIDKEINEISESVKTDDPKQTTTKIEEITSEPEKQAEAKPTPAEEKPTRPPEPQRTMTNEEYHSMLQAEAAAKQEAEDQASATAKTNGAASDSSQIKHTDEEVATTSPQDKTPQPSTESKQ